MPMIRRVARRTARRTSRRVGRRQEALGGYQNEPQEMQETTSQESVTDELDRLYQLKKEGAISDAEYEQQKRQLLNK